MTPEQAALAHDTVIVPVRIELRNPFGQVIAEFTVREQHGEYGGLGSFGAMLRAVDVRELNVPIDVPGLDPRAKFYFHVERGVEGRTRFVPLAAALA